MLSPFSGFIIVFIIDMMTRVAAVAAAAAAAVVVVIIIIIVNFMISNLRCFDTVFLGPYLTFIIGS